MKTKYLFLLLPIAMIGIAATYTITQLTENATPGAGTIIEIYDPTATPKSGKITLDSAGFRNAAGLAIGTDVQPYDVDVSSLSAGKLGVVHGYGNGLFYDATAPAVGFFHCADGLNAYEWVTALEADSLTVTNDATIGGDLDVTGTLTVGTHEADELILTSLTETNKLLGIGATTNAMVATKAMWTNTAGIFNEVGTDYIGGDGAIHSLPAQIGAIGITIDGGGAEITDGIKGDIYVPYACTINSVTLLADQSGSAVVDIWKDTYANYPPTDADTITSAAVPTITTAAKGQDTTLTGWTTAVSAGDTIRFNVDSCTTIQRLTLVLKVTK